MVKYILTALMLISVAYAQEPAYTFMRLNYEFRGIKVDSLFLIPSFADTATANTRTIKNVAGAMIRTGNDFWMRNSNTTAWLQNINVGSGAAYNLDLQDVTDNGDSSDALITLYGNLSGGLYGNSVEIGADTNFNKTGIKIKSIDDNNLIELYNEKAGDPYLVMKDTLGNHYFEIHELNSGSTSIYDNGDLNLQAYDFLTITSNKLDIINLESYIHSYDTLRINADTGWAELKASDINIKAIDDMTIDCDDIFNIQGAEMYITTSNFLEIDIPSNTPIVIGPSSAPLEKGYILQNRSDSIDLSSTSFTALVPGVYRIWNGNSNDFVFPDATEWIGQMVIIINSSGLTIDISGSQNIYDRGTGNILTTITSDKMGTFFSDGLNWYGFTQ